MKRNVKIKMAKFLASTLMLSGGIAGGSVDLVKDFSSSTISSLVSVLEPTEVYASAVSLALPYVNETTQSNSSTYQQSTTSYNNNIDPGMSFGVLPDNSYQQSTTSYNNNIDPGMSFGVLPDNSYQQSITSYNNNIDPGMSFGVLPDNSYQQSTTGYDDSTATFGMIFGNNSGSTYQQPNNGADYAMSFGALPNSSSSYNSGVDYGMTFGALSGDNIYQQPTASYNNGVANYDDYTMMITGNSNNNNSYAPAISGISFKIGETSSIIDVAPYVENGNTMIPVRAMANLLGVSDSNITYDNNTQKVTITYYGRVISLTIGDNKLYVTENGTTTVKSMDNGAKAVTKEGRTFVPVRAISEAFGLQVTWDNNTQTVTLKS